MGVQIPPAAPNGKASGSLPEAFLFDILPPALAYGQSFRFFLALEQSVATSTRSSNRSSKRRGNEDKTGQGSELASNRSVLLLIGLALVLFFVFSYLERINELINVRAQVESLQSDIAQAEQRKAELEAAKEEVAGATYVGETARAELGLIQPGDDPFVILGQDAQSVEAKGEGQQTAPSAPPGTGGKGIFDPAWWRALFGLQ